jgi:diguanylate cyclase (GGDEF)-like protein
MNRIRLEGVAAPLVNRHWEAKHSVIIGRSSGAQISLRDRSVSRRHAEVAWVNPNWVLRDLGSTNGTFRNGQRVGRGGDRLQLYDIVQVGQYQLIVTRMEPERPACVRVEGPPQADAIAHLVRGLAQVAETGSGDTRGHGEHVAEYALMLARELELSDASCFFLEAGAPLHDIGTIGIGHILGKRTVLTPEEWAVIRSHPARGDDMVENVPELAALRPIIRSHHERWDGKGYPDGLSGENIPLLARIVSLADAFDAMTSERASRPARSAADAFAEIEAGSGTQFDPRCCAAFLSLRQRIQRLLEQRDSISSKTLRVELQELAYSDPLTGLPNRVFFDLTLSHAMATAREKNCVVATLFADLDGFKVVNDHWGHHAGDCLLGVIARRLKGCVRERDVVARLGGDEFGLVLGGLLQRRNAVVLARKIVRALAQPCVIEDKTVCLTASIGISFHPGDATDPKELVKKADFAMYQAKKLGKNRALTYRAADRLAARHQVSHE